MNTSSTAPPIRGILTSLSLAMLLSSLGTSIANIGLPTLGKAFSAPFPQVQWVVLSYLLSLTSLVILAGRLGDLLGRRRLLLIGLLWFSLTSLLCGLAPSLPWLIAARGLQGIGAAILLAHTLALVSETLPKEQSGRAMGLMGTLSAVGTALGPTLGGTLITYTGWRGLFLVLVPISLLAWLLGQRYLPKPAEQSHVRLRLDLPGTVLLVIALSSYALAMTLNRGHMGSLNLLLLAVATAALLLFWQVERRSESPLVPPDMLRNPLLSGGLAMSGLVSTVIMSTLVIGPFYLTHTLNLTAGAAGLVMSCGPIASALSSNLAGRLVDRFGNLRMTRLGLIGMLTGSTMLGLIAPHPWLPGYMLSTIWLTASYALFQTANNTGVMATSGPAQRGVTSGMLNLSRNLGLTTGTALLGTVFAAGSGSLDINHASAIQIAQGMQTSFAMATGLTLLALLLAWRVSRVALKTEPISQSS